MLGSAHSTCFQSPVLDFLTSGLADGEQKRRTRVRRSRVGDDGSTSLEVQVDVCRLAGVDARDSKQFGGRSLESSREKSPTLGFAKANQRAMLATWASCSTSTLRIKHRPVCHALFRRTCRNLVRGTFIVQRLDVGEDHPLIGAIPSRLFLGTRGT